MIPNLNEEQEIRNRQLVVVRDTRQAMENKDTLLMAKCAETWRELGEEKTAELCDWKIIEWQIKENERTKQT